MQVENTPQMMLEMFYKLRTLANAEIAVLTAWRDVEAYAMQHDFELVPPSHFDEWWDVATRAITTIKWLTTLYPSPTEDKPDYWARWDRDLIDAVVRHVTRTLDIQGGNPRF